MRGVTSLPSTERLERTLAIAIAAIAALWCLTVAAPVAHASGCTDSWTNSKGGSWFEGGNWSKNAPPTSSEEACITESGTYTVTMNQTSEGVTVKALTLGAASGTQTLSVGSTCGAHAKLTTTAGLTVGAQGALILTNGDGCGNNVTIVGPLANAGTLTSEPAHGGQRNLQGGLTNTGTLAINANTSYNGSAATLTNEGAVDVATGVLLSVEGDTFVNATGGKIVTSGTGSIFVSHGAFDEGAGTASGTLPVIVDDGAVDYEGAGESTIAQRGESSTLSGASSAKQALIVQSTCGEHVRDTAGLGFTNGGSIALTNGDGCGNNATLVGAIVNSGTITTEQANGGQRNLQGNLTNTGTLAIKWTTSYNGAGATLTNRGTIEVAEGLQLVASGKSTTVNNGASGKILASNNSDVLLEPETAFIEGAGTTSGTLPVIVRDGALTYEGAGESTIAVHGESSTLSGNTAAKQTLILQSTCGEHVKETAATSWTNGGSIVLTNGDGCGNNATLVTPAGTLTNTGTITTQQANGGQRNLQGNLTNKGTIALNANTSDPVAATIQNEGKIAIASGVSFSLPAAPSFTNGTGGQISASGSGALLQTGGTFTEAKGVTAGSEPVILDDLTLKYTGNGASTISLRGASQLSGGPINSGQTLLISSTCSEHAKASTSGSFTNNGTIELTNGDGCGDNAVLNLAGGTLTNSGALVALNPHGGLRVIEGSVTSSKIVWVQAGSTLKVEGTYKQSAGIFAVSVAGASDFGSLSVTGAATIAGTLGVVKVGSFTPSLGQTLAVLGASSLTGTFAAELGDQINPTGLYYKPTYSSSGASIVASQATLALSAKSGLPGSVVTVSGSGYQPGETITPGFIDHKNVKTFFAPVVANSSGEFSAEVTIPAGAAVGGGIVGVISAKTDLTITKPFSVT